MPNLSSSNIVCGPCNLLTIILEAQRKQKQPDDDDPRAYPPFTGFTNVESSGETLGSNGRRRQQIIAFLQGKVTGCRLCQMDSILKGRFSAGAITLHSRQLPTAAQPLDAL